MYKHFSLHRPAHKASTIFTRPIQTVGLALALLSTTVSGASVTEPAATDTAAITTPVPEAPPKPTSEKAAETTEVVVVGSRIRRSTFNSPSPIQLITREEATAAGFNSTTDMLQSTAVTAGASQINNAYGNYVTDGGSGANTISLRGLGATRTLVLINGRRVAPAGTRGAVGSADLNVLPTAIIDHIEILQDGASSIYGSDAIGGVVNVITMSKLDGITLEGESNIPTEGAGQQNRFSMAGGFSDDRWSISGSADIYERQNLTLGDRNWTKCAIDGLRNPETGASTDYIDPNTGKPKCSTITGAGTSGVTINTIGTQKVSDTNYTDLGLNGAPVGAPGTETSAFTRFRPNAAITTGVIGFEGVGGGGNNLNVRDTFDPRMLNENLISPATIFTSFVQGKYDLQTLGNAEFYFEFLGHHRTSNQSSFRQLSLDYRRGSALIPAALGFSDFGPDQGTSDGERVGVRAFIAFGLDHSEQYLTFTKPLIGIKGDFAFLPDWKYDAYATFSKSDAEYRTESFLQDKVTYSTDAVAAPSGIDTALISNGLTCRVNLTNPAERCILSPVLNAATIGGNLPQSFKDYIFREVVGKTTYEESVFSATIDGPLAEVAAGKIQGVLGLEHRRAKIDDEPDQNSIDGNLYNLTSAAPTKGKDNVTEVYTEIEVPLLADDPIAKELMANGSYRFTDYDSYGSGKTYKLGLVYKPSTWVTLRGTKGTSFRAPALFEQFQGATSGFLSSANDPCNDYGAEDVNPNRVRNCDSELHQPDFQSTSGIKTLNVGGAAAGLAAETSNNVTYGIIFEPDLGDAGELSLAMDYFDIKIQNGVAQAGASAILSRCYDDPKFHSGGGLCRLVTRDPSTNALTVSDAYTNLATEYSRGVDFNGRYRSDIGPGKLTIDMHTTRYHSQAQKIFSNDPLEELNGNIMSPAWSGTNDVTYSLTKWSLVYGIEWVGPMDGYAYAGEDPATSELNLKVPSYFKHRASVHYESNAWNTTVGIRNLTNKTPPTISALVFDRVGNAPLYSAYDYVGREFFINLQLHY